MTVRSYTLAIDIGASSGRHILGWLEDGKLVLQEIYRFENRQLRQQGHDCWDMAHLWENILAGMRRCGELGMIPASVGIDTWAVDYVLLDKSGQALGPAIAYRDSRTEGMDAATYRIVPESELYARTGIQKQIFNTVFQLMAQKAEDPALLDRAAHLLMLPDYFHYRLTGQMRQEYTNASSTGLLDAGARNWDYDLIRRLGLPERLFVPPAQPGERLGPLLPGIAEIVGYQTEVILPATHDTGSAFLAVPAQDEHAVYLSSGTWSLLGVENDVPILTEASRLQNFTNEGGAFGNWRYLKNIMGLWMIQSIRRELNGTAYVAGREIREKDGRQWSYPDLIAEAEQAADFPSLVDVNNDCFLAPENMQEAVRDYCRRSGQAVPETVGELMQCVYRSLARCYREAVTALSGLTGKTYTAIHIVGGGSQDDYLNRLTAEATGLPVYAGPIEGTALGNLIVQMMTAGEIKTLAAARQLIRDSFIVREVKA